MSKLNKNYGDSTRIAINQYSGVEWYKQLNPNAELLSGAYSSENTEMYIYNKAQNFDIWGQKKCLHITEECRIRFPNGNFDTYDYYIKFYKVVTNWVSHDEHRRGSRLVYSIIGDCVHNHSYEHPQAIKIIDGVATFPVGFYGYRGWEILQVYKGDLDRNSYRINDEPYIGKYLDFTSNEFKHFETNEVKIINDKPLDYSLIKEYAVPYFNIQGSPVSSIGYYEEAIEEHSNEEGRFITESEINPFKSNKTKKWNFCKPILIFNGENLPMNDSLLQIKKDSSNKLLISKDGITWNDIPEYRDGDHIIIYVRTPGKVITKNPIQVNEILELKNLQSIKSGYTYVNDLDDSAYLIKGNLSSNHELDFTNSINIYELDTNVESPIFITDGFSIYGANLVPIDKKYNLYKSIIKTKTISLKTTTITRPTTGSIDGDYNEIVDPYDHRGIVSYAAVGDYFNFNPGKGEYSVSPWTGKYTINITLKDIPYIKDISPQINLSDPKLSVELIKTSLSQTHFIDIPSIQLYKNILQTSTAGIFPNTIYGLKGENMYMYNKTIETALRLDSDDIKNIKISLNYYNHIGLLYPEDKGPSNALWVVLWRY